MHGYRFNLTPAGTGGTTALTGTVPLAAAALVGAVRSVAALGLAALAFAGAPSHASAQTPPGPDATVPDYNLHLTLDPAARHIRVTGTVTLPGSDTARFFLHRQLRIRSFGVRGIGEHTVDRSESGIRYLPEAVAVTVPPAGEGAMEIAFTYEGTITEWPEWSPNVIGPRWTELGLYLPWFPFAPDALPFTYRLEVVTDTGSTVVAMGDPERAGRRRVFRRTRPTNDIAVVAAPGLRVRESRVDESAVRLAATDLAEATMDTILADAYRLQALYADWFGPVGGDMLLVASDREEGGGYARMGGAFLAGLEDDEYLAERTGYLRYIGHELAHLWWYRADPNSWEDWLNESMAEVSALMAVRERVGPAEYDRRLVEKREAAAGTPPIIGFDRNGNDARAVLYSKGPVLLAELEARIGKRAFRDLARTLIERNVATTAGFLDTLEEMEGAGVRAWLEARLQGG